MDGKNINSKFANIIQVIATLTPHIVLFVIILLIGISSLFGDPDNTIIVFFSCYSMLCSIFSWISAYKDIEKHEKIAAFFLLFFLFTAIIIILICVLTIEQRNFVANISSLFFMLFTIIIEGLVFLKSK